VLVEWVSGNLVLDEEMELVAKLHHKGSAWGDCVAVKQIWDVLALGLQLLFQNLRVFGTAESARSLLVHFGAGSHTIDCKQQNLLGLDSVDQLVNGSHDGRPHFL
jgi:hypothetical protein